MVAGSADLGRGDNMLSSLFNLFSDIVVFDVETSGTDPKRDEIIEIAMLRTVSERGVLPVPVLCACSIAKILCSWHITRSST